MNLRRKYHCVVHHLKHFAHREINHFALQFHKDIEHMMERVIIRERVDGAQLKCHSIDFNRRHMRMVLKSFDNRFQVEHCHHQDSLVCLFMVQEKAIHPLH